MVCRCDDIQKYEHDIGILEKAVTCIQDIIDYQKNLDDSIDILKSSYIESINPPSNLAANIDSVHGEALSNARLAKTQIDGALSTARVKLRKAKEEDDKFHALEKKETIS